MPNSTENRLFGEQMICADPLDVAIEWIQSHMEPEDVFTGVDLEHWAEQNGFVKS